MNEAGLYLHIPFCRTKCGYCAFNSIAAPPGGVVDDYLDLLSHDISSYASLPWTKEQTFTTIFIGGGTPSLASPAKLANILDLCRSTFRIAEQAEVSMEANPDSIDQTSLATLRKAGVNRLSIGVQSFNDTILKKINRPHSARQALLAVEAARKSGFNNLNLDLIYGLPGQSLAHWQHDLLQALSLDPDHLALYELTIEPKTPFARALSQKKLVLPDEDLLADMEELTAKLLTPALQRYEISNYARPGLECLHNINYWQNGSYIGLGAGAVSCLDGLRISHEPDPQRFMTLAKQKKTTISHAECLSIKGRFRESMIMGLRLLAGLDLAGLERRLDVSAAEVYGSLLTDFQRRGMLVRDGNMIRLTPNYLALANQILAKLV